MTAAGTAEPEEIARFERLAATWWDEAGPMRPLHQLNPPRLEFLRDHLAAHFGRDPKAVERTVMIDDDEIDDYQAYLDAGADHIILGGSYPFALDNVEKLLAYARD